jgi:hypothetical protein
VVYAGSQISCRFRCGQFRSHWNNRTYRKLKRLNRIGPGVKFGVMARGVRSMVTWACSQASHAAGTPPFGFSMGSCRPFVRVFDARRGRLGPPVNLSVPFEQWWLMILFPVMRDSGRPSDLVHQRKVLEKRWHQRVEEAKLRLDSARQYTTEVERNFPIGEVPPPDGNFVRRRALQAENVALGDFHRVLRIYTELVVNGKVPDENDGR